MQSDAMPRLRAANPIIAEAGRGQEPIAQAALQRILATPPRPAAATARRRVRPRSLIVIVAVLLLGAGGAVAATDPLGWWSNNPGQAHFRVNPGLRVPTPSAQQIRCRAGAGNRFVCAPAETRCFQVGQQAPHCKLSGRGLPYMRIDTVRAPPRNSLLSRPGFTRAIAKAQRAGTMTAAQAAQFRSDLAAVGNSFFTEMRLASRYQSAGFGGTTRKGKEFVPPADQPTVLVCIDASSRISCQNINGDPDTPVGAAVYGAVQQRGWRWVAAPRYFGGLPPGVHFTSADYRVLIDLVRFGTASQHTSGQLHATTVPITHLPARHAHKTRAK
jgi:hypothetical protein